MAFYAEMAAMAADLLKPDAQGGLGQGEIVLIRSTPGTVDEGAPWEPVEPTTEQETLRAAASGALPSGSQAEEYGDGVTILSTDIKVIAAVPAMDWRMTGDDGSVLSMTIDGRPMTIVRVRGIPEAGTTAAVEFIARN